jgi:hypothetical protein
MPMCSPGKLKPRINDGGGLQKESIVAIALSLFYFSTSSHRKPTVKQILSLVLVCVSEINIKQFFSHTLYTAGKAVKSSEGSPGLRKG